MVTAEAFWDGSAQKYAKSKIKDEKSYALTLERVRNHLNPGDRVFELGGGTGTTAIKLHHGVASYVMSDVSTKMREIAKRRAIEAGAGNIEVVAADASSIGDRAESFDAVLAFNLLHLLPDVPKTVADVRCLLKPGGLFISKTPCFSGRPMMRGLVGVMKLVGKAPPHVWFLSPDEIEQLQIDAGFEIIERGDFPPKVPSRFTVARRVG
ncbi:MAG: class I SAM-dependent methyltransferase [Pseudomonadota bacterium]